MKRKPRTIPQMHLSLRLRTWALNGFLLLAGLYAMLGIFALVNFLSLPYSPLMRELPGSYTIHLILLSPSLDQYLLYALSVVVVVAALCSLGLSYPWVGGVGKYALGWLLLSLPLLILRLILSLLGAPAFGDVLLFLAGVISVGFTLLFSPHHLGVSRRCAVTRFLICTCSVMLVIAILSATVLASYPIHPHLPQNRPLWRFVDLENQLFHIPSSLVPIIFTLTLLAWLIKPLWTALKALPKVGATLDRKASDVSSWVLPNLNPESIPPRKWKAKPALIVLSFSMAFTIFYVLYPFVLADGLTRNVSWSMDVGNYVQCVQELGAQEGAHLVSYALSSFPERALSLLFMYAAWQVTGASAWTVMKFTPLVLAPLLCLAVFFLMHHLVGDAFNASLAALFTVFSFHITVGFGVAFFSNWMALIILYLTSGLLLKSLRQKSWKWAALAAATMVLLLLTHAYTWVMLMGVLGVFTIFLGVEWLRGRRSLFAFRVLGATIAMNLSADLIKNALLSATLGVATETTQLGLQSLAWQNIARYWSTVQLAFTSWSGLYNNPPLLLLALLGTLALLCDARTRRHAYLLSFLVAASLPFVLGGESLQIRILYNLPLQVLALYGLIAVSQLIQRHVEPPEGRVLVTVLTLLVILMNINYALRCTVRMVEHIHPI